MSLHLHKVAKADLRIQRLAQPRGKTRGLRVVRVASSRPEEAAQSVLATARHDVCMQVRNALTDDVVHRHKCPFRVERIRHQRADPLHHFEELWEQISREIRECGYVLAGYYQDMALENRSPVEERDDLTVVVNHQRSVLTSTDGAKDTPGHGHRVCTVTRTRP